MNALIKHQCPICHDWFPTPDEALKHCLNIEEIIAQVFCFKCGHSYGYAHTELNVKTAELCCQVKRKKCCECCECSPPEPMAMPSRKTCPGCRKLVCSKCMSHYDHRCKSCKTNKNS